MSGYNPDHPYEDEKYVPPSSHEGDDGAPPPSDEGQDSPTSWDEEDTTTGDTETNSGLGSLGLKGYDPTTTIWADGGPLRDYSPDGDQFVHNVLSVCVGAACLAVAAAAMVALWNNFGILMFFGCVTVAVVFFYIGMVYWRRRVTTAETLIDLKGPKNIKATERIMMHLRNDEQLWSLVRGDINVIMKWAIPTTFAVVVVGWALVKYASLLAALIGVVVLVIPLAIEWLIWYRHIYGFSDVRAFELSGVISTKFKEAPFDKVASIDYIVSRYEWLLAFFRFNYVPSGMLLFRMPKDDDDDESHQAMTSVVSIPAVLYHKRRCAHFRERRVRGE